MPVTVVASFASNSSASDLRHWSLYEVASSTASQVTETASESNVVVAARPVGADGARPSRIRARRTARSPRRCTPAPALPLAEAGHGDGGVGACDRRGVVRVELLGVGLAPLQLV